MLRRLASLSAGIHRILVQKFMSLADCLVIEAFDHLRLLIRRCIKQIKMAKYFCIFPPKIRKLKSKTQNHFGNNSFLIWTIWISKISIYRALTRFESQHSKYPSPSIHTNDKLKPLNLTSRYTPKLKKYLSKRHPRRMGAQGPPYLMALAHNFPNRGLSRRFPDPSHQRRDQHQNGDHHKLCKEKFVSLDVAPDK